MNSKIELNTLIGNPAVLKQVNMVRIMNHLRIEGPASRAELARTTGLDAKTITNICNSLFAKGLTEAQEAKASGRGRPAESIKIKDDAAFSIGVDIGATQISVVAIDLAGNLQYKDRLEFGICKDSEFLLDKAKMALKKIQRSLIMDKRKKICGVGICVPGFLDRTNGIVIDSVNIAGFKGFKIRHIIEKITAFPVILEESSRSMAIAELWFGRRNVCSDFICVDMGFGIGAGIVHNGLLYRGAHELGGEIGHMVVVPDGLACSCGKRGCLETVASGHALQNLAKKLKLSTNLQSYGGKALHEAALAGNVEAHRALSNVGRHIGVAIANVINLFDPSKVVLAGGLLKAGDFLLDSLRTAVKDHSVERMAMQCDIKVSELGDFAGAMGAAMLPLRHYFEFENIRF